MFETGSIAEAAARFAAAEVCFRFTSSEDGGKRLVEAVRKSGVSIWSEWLEATFVALAPFAATSLVEVQLNGASLVTIDVGALPERAQLVEINLAIDMRAV